MRKSMIAAFLLGVTFLCIILFYIMTVVILPNEEEYENIYSSKNSNFTPDFSTNLVEEIPKTYYNITEEEKELLARLVTCEASICSVECQKDVCSVVFNRLDSDKWKRDMNNDGQITLYDIVYYPNAFSPTINGALDKCSTPCKSAYEAVDYVIENGPTVPTYVRYFRTDHDFSWDGYKNYKVIDNVYFGYFENWHKGAW